MNITDRFLDPPYEYDFERGPDIVRKHEDARQGGLNCIALAHLAIHDLYGETLPKELHAYEMFADDERFKNVPSIGDMQTGDLLWFGLAQPRVGLSEFRPAYQGSNLTNWIDFPVRHVGVFIGEFQDADAQVLHVSRYTGTSVIWPLSEFGLRTRYAKLYGVRRYMAEADRIKLQQEPHIQATRLL